MSYTCILSEKFLSKEEREVFTDQLSVYGLDDGIWDVFASLFNSGLKHTQPLLVRVNKNENLTGAIVITKCSRYGKALFDNRFLAGLINLIAIPYYQWIKFGCCMDMMSNPGFVKDPEEAEEVIKAAIQFLKKKGMITIVNDYTDNAALFPGASVLPALPHAIIVCSRFDSIQDYLTSHKNIKRKLKVFHNKGGEYIRVEQTLDAEKLEGLKKCFISTAQNSIFYLPYQDLYLKAALTTSQSRIKNVIYFIAMLNGEFIGYQAALKSGQHLNALHGAFDRSHKTTHHAYDILFVKMTEYAIENGLKVCDFGAVLNYTKQKMVNKTLKLSYFIYSRYALIQGLFKLLLKTTKIQGSEQLKFNTN